MTGTVQQVLVQSGDTVSPGTPLLVMEAMKLQLRLTAEVAGTVSAIETEAGALVSEGQVLVRITPEKEAS
jgi:urea carboxylase